MFTAGPWAITDNIVGATNSTTAQISAIETRVHIINLKGDFVADIPFKGYTSGATAQPTSFLKAEAVTDNTGGKLTVDTASLLEHLKKPQLFILLLLDSSSQFPSMQDLILVLVTELHPLDTRDLVLILLVVSTTLLLVTDFIRLYQVFKILPHTVLSLT